MNRTTMNFFTITAILQGVYYFLTGIWAIIDIESFMQVTGPKVDIWLVKMVGVLIIVISMVLLYAGFRKNITAEIILLGVASAIGFIIIDVYYATSDRISSVYLLDALAEAVLLFLWGIAFVKKRNNADKAGRIEGTNPVDLKRSTIKKA